MNVLKNLTISVAFYGKLLQFDEKKIQRREQPMLARLHEINWQKSGKKGTYLSGIFCFQILKNMAQNNNDSPEGFMSISDQSLSLGQNYIQI